MIEGVGGAMAGEVSGLVDVWDVEVGDGLMAVALAARVWVGVVGEWVGG